MPEKADREANKILRDGLDDARGRYWRLMSHVDELRTRLASLRVSAVSPDGMVEAVVGARGELLDLRIDHQVYRTIDSDDLAQTILETTQTATRKSREEVAGLMPPASADFVRDGDYRGLLDG